VTPVPVACFVTPHGFGHAARACALLEALAERMPLAAEVFTTVPEWFFHDSLSVPFRHHALRTDVGLVQRDALDEDLAGTVRELDAFVPRATAEAPRLAARLRELGCMAVLADVAPLGIAAAGAAGIPSVLVENFTWDWIYEAYDGLAPGLRPHAAALGRWFAGAGLHVQTAPVCRPAPGAIRVEPVARRPRRRRDEVRRELGIEPGQRAVLVTMGGVGWDYAGLVAGTGPRLPDGVVLVVPGGAPAPRRLPWARLLPFHSTFYHPDLVAAADAVVGKLGYSTLAECWGSGVPFGYVPRPTFAESPVLARALEEVGAGVAVDATLLTAPSWAWLETVLALPRRQAGRPLGNASAAAAISAWLAS
jgi:hypothetical protein